MAKHCLFNKRNNHKRFPYWKEIKAMMTWVLNILFSYLIMILLIYRKIVPVMVVINLAIILCLTILEKNSVYSPKI